MRSVSSGGTHGESGSSGRSLEDAAGEGVQGEETEVCPRSEQVGPGGAEPRGLFGALRGPLRGGEWTPRWRVFRVPGGGSGPPAGNRWVGPGAQAGAGDGSTRVHGDGEGLTRNGEASFFFLCTHDSQRWGRGGGRARSTTGNVPATPVDRTSPPLPMTLQRGCPGHRSYSAGQPCGLGQVAARPSGVTSDPVWPVGTPRCTVVELGL